MRQLTEKGIFNVLQIGIAVFAYNRSLHLQRVLDGLRQNDFVDQLYLFQDGMRCGEDDREWEKTRKLISGISWCKTIVTIQKENMGLAQSIVMGVDKVLQENDAVVVLEDDCVPHPDFIRFMKQCFEIYKDNRSVYSVSGYAWPCEVEKEEEIDNYFCGRISSWGWGTWKDRWLEYEMDYTLIKKIKENPQAKERLDFWGDDLEQMLVRNVCGEIDSWAVFWALKVIQKNGLCVNPYNSLIQNIGMDGTGTHCGNTDRYDVSCSADRKRNFVLSENFICNKSLKNNFLFGNPLVQKKDKDSRFKVLIYGIGQCYQDHKKELGKQYRIIALIDKNKKEISDGYQILKPKKMCEFEYDNLIIMNKNLKLSLQIAQELIGKYHVEPRKIKLGCILYESRDMICHRILPDATCEIELAGICVGTFPK